MWIKRDVADLVDDQQRDALQPVELGIQASLALGVGEQGNPLRRRLEEHAVAGEAGTDPERDREVRLPVPGGPSRTTLSLPARKSSWPRCSTLSRRTEV
jgi:hypothetical protein